MKEIVEELTTFVAKFLFGAVLVPMVVIVLMALILLVVSPEASKPVEPLRQTSEEFTFIDPFEDSPLPPGLEYRGENK